eukprot:SAG22_NODE_684_length_7918_cov_6.380356_5_plen_138_part_00
MQTRMIIASTYYAATAGMRTDLLGGTYALPFCCASIELRLRQCLFMLSCSTSGAGMRADPLGGGGEQLQPQPVAAAEGESRPGEGAEGRGGPAADDKAAAAARSAAGCRKDWARFCPGVRPGQPLASKLNPELRPAV